MILTYTPLGFTVNGNRNWLVARLSLFALQPSEFAKLAMIIWGADVLARKQRLLDQPKHLLVPYLPVGRTVDPAGRLPGRRRHRGGDGRDRGRMLWIVGAPMRVLAALAAAGVAGVVALFVSRRSGCSRLAAFLDPTADLDGVNDQANAGMCAIASGGWWGVGLGASRQKWGSLPEAHSDFIFAVIGEELGLFGSLVVLALFVVLGYAGIRIAIRSDDPFARYAAAGVTAWFMVQALINLGCRAPAAADRRRPAAAGLLRRVGADRQPAGRRGAAGLRPPRAGRPQAAGREARRPKPRMTTVVGSRRAAKARDERIGPDRSRVVLAGGGTAGHTSPLIATAQELRRLAPGLRLTAVGTARGLETTVVPAAGLALELIPPVPMPRRPGLDLAAGRAAARPAVRADASGCSRRSGPTWCSASAATSRRRSTWRPGGSGCRSSSTSRTCCPGWPTGSRPGSPAHVYTSFPHTPLPHATCIGLPLRRGDHRARPGRAREPRRARPFGLAAGSADAAGQRRLAGRAEHQPAPSWAPGTGCWRPASRCCTCSGRRTSPTDTSATVDPDTGAVYAPVAYVEQMEQAYAAADLMLGRCGASTVLETAAVGLPAVFVPYPHGNGEQARNADWWSRPAAGCCWPTPTARRSGWRPRSRR